MLYTVENGIIQAEKVELNVTHHCNLTCRGCTHLSPTVAKSSMSPETVLRDLTDLSHSMKVRFVSILGGEPLLHPDIINVIKAARESDISPNIRVTTNGVMLPRMAEEFWAQVDEVQISEYPGVELAEEQIEACTRLAEKYETRFVIWRYEEFREGYSETGTDDSKLISRIYSTCLQAHAWDCFTVQDGHFFKCPPSVFLPRVLGTSQLADPFADGIRIEPKPEFADQILAYLKSTKPLAACRHCLGSSGKSFYHEQLGRKDWRAHQQSTSEQMLDEPNLEWLEAGNTEYKNDNVEIGFRELVPGRMTLI